MAAAVIGLATLGAQLPPLALVLLAGLVGGLLYLGLCLALRVEAFGFFIGAVRERLGRCRELILRLGMIMSDESSHPTASERREVVDRRLLELLVCPLTKTPLEYDEARQELISRDYFSHAEARRPAEL